MKNGLSAGSGAASMGELPPGVDLDALLSGLDPSVAEALGLNMCGVVANTADFSTVHQCAPAGYPRVCCGWCCKGYAGVAVLLCLAISSFLPAFVCSMSDKPPPPDLTTLTPGQLREDNDFVLRAL
jgi:hypothetical protein